MPIVEIIILAIAVLGFILVPLFIILYFRKSNAADFTVSGMSFKCQPSTMIPKIHRTTIANYLDVYALGMADAFGVSPSAIKTHFERVCCYFQKGYLPDTSRVQAGLDDVGTKILGLTANEAKMTIAVLFEDDDRLHSMIDADGMINIKHTAFLYELHNTAIFKFKSYEVGLMESFVNPNDTIIQKILKTDLAGATALKTQRQALDKVFYSLVF